MDFEWKGIVLSRTREHSYVVQVKPGVKQEAHMSQLRVHVEDEYSSDLFPIWYLSRRAPTVDTTDPILADDEYIWETILGHEVDTAKLRVKWKGYGAKEATWEPVSTLLHEDLREYLAKNGLTLSITSSPSPSKPKPKTKPKSSSSAV